MPRYRRLFIPHAPLHIVQRGHDRKPVFAQSEDYRFYLDNLFAAKQDFSIQVLSYCLMTNHIHLVVVPGDDTAAISKLMRVLAGRQTRHVNKLERRSGTLWEGRFKASLIDTERYLLACCRYVDLNPVRAMMVAAPEEYKWSSFRGRADFSHDPILDRHPVFEALGEFPEQRARAYYRFVTRGTSDDELSIIRQALQRNQLTGDARFKIEIEARIGRRLSARAQGRPKKEAGEYT